MLGKLNIPQSKGRKARGSERGETWFLVTGGGEMQKNPEAANSKQDNMFYLNY